ncbi:unnamed protein product [Victoria cruziana]
MRTVSVWVPTRRSQPDHFIMKKLITLKHHNLDQNMAVQMRAGVFLNCNNQHLYLSLVLVYNRSDHAPVKRMAGKGCL